MSRQPASGVGSTPDDKQDSGAPESRAPATDATEVGGPKGPEPTRYGDWEKNGRCIDF